MTLRDLSEKDVIQLKTGENLGRIDDLAFEDGQITQVVLHGRARMFGLLGRDDVETASRTMTTAGLLSKP